jgi:hypothetical protein
MPDARTNEKLNPLFDGLPPIRGKLAGLERNRFAMLQDRTALDVECDPSLLRIEPLSDAEVAALAAQTSARRSACSVPSSPQCDELGRSDAAGGAGTPVTWAH